MNHISCTMCCVKFLVHYCWFYFCLLSFLMGLYKSYKFLNEFIEVGGILTTLEILGLRQATEVGIYWELLTVDLLV